VDSSVFVVVMSRNNFVDSSVFVVVVCRNNFVDSSVFVVVVCLEIKIISRHTTTTKTLESTKLFLDRLQKNISSI
jgi:hypothetical protein